MGYKLLTQNQGAVYHSRSSLVPTIANIVNTPFPKHSVRPAEAFTNLGLIILFAFMNNWAAPTNQSTIMLQALMTTQSKL